MSERCGLPTSKCAFSFALNSTIFSSRLQKIDKLKRQLTEMADLFKEDAAEGLDDEEYEMLQEAGIIPPSKKRKRPARHLVFAESLEEGVPFQFLWSQSRPLTSVAFAAQSLGRKQDSAPELSEELSAPPQNDPQDLGWTVVESKKKKKSRQPSRQADDVNLDQDMEAPEPSTSSMDKRSQLLKEIGARLVRDRQLRYTMREFEMQRLMMGKGAAQKISAVEKVGNEDDEDSDDEDALDARGGRRTKKTKTVDEATYKPRVYKWKLERKK